MGFNLLLGLSTMAFCLLLQTMPLVVAFRYYQRHERRHAAPGFWSMVGVMNGVMLILIAGNLAQVALWALLFLGLGEFGDFPEAFYHSAVNFATLGYGDVVMSERHRLLGPLEAINGVLMFGISTATLSWAFQDSMHKLRQARQQRES